MNWLKRLFGKRKSAAEQEKTPTPATPATTEKPAPSTAEPAPEAAATPEAVATEAVTDTESAAAPEATAAETAADTEAAAPAPKSNEPTASEPAAESEPAPAADAADPAMSVLDDVERAAELQTATPEASAQEGPYGPASAKPASDGAPPSAEFTIKGKESSKLFHTEESPYFGRTKADVWFKSAADAESAGFTAYTRKKATAKK